MYEKHPTCIITDQDSAMRVAIKKIFSNTIHRCCQWHVMRKAREHFLKHYEMHPGLEAELKAVRIHSLTVPEFESSWEKMLKDFKIENNGH
jgi:MULE transposase domain